MATKFIFTTWPPENWPNTSHLGLRTGTAFAHMAFTGSTDYGPSKDGGGLATVFNDASGCC